VLLDPQDSYYEQDNDVYCHYHFSTRFATKCMGCETAILKQSKRDTRDECWHPECYMINEVSRRPCISVHTCPNNLKSWNVEMVHLKSAVLKGLRSGSTEPPYAEEEARETHASLREKQIKMGRRVSRIWTYVCEPTPFM